MASPEFGPVRLHFRPAIVHQLVSADADGADATLVRPSDWNATHHAPDVVVPVTGLRLEWPSMGAGLAELFDLAEHRVRFDATRCAQVRLEVPVLRIGGASAKARLQYTTDTTGATGWTYADGSAGPSLSIAAAGVIVSAWVSLAAGAKADVLWRVVGLDG